MFISNAFSRLTCRFGKVRIYSFNKKIKKVKSYGKDGVYSLKKKIKKS